MCLHQQKSVILYDSPSKFARELITSLESYYVKTTMVSTLDDFKANLHKEVNNIQCIMIGNSLEHSEWIEVCGYVESLDPIVPIVVIKETLTLHDRLLVAAQYAIKRLYTINVDMRIIIAQLDQLAKITENMPRVLLSTSSRSNIHQSNFRAGSMELSIVNKNTEVLDYLAKIRLVDLIICDHTDASLSGLELSTVLHQWDLYNTIPLIILTDRLDPKLRARAIGQGTTYVIPKFVRSTDLVTIARSIIYKSRLDHSQQLFDATTGLYSHYTIWHLLDLEISRHIRDTKPLSLALISIDHADLVVSTHGHLMLDQVQASLGSLLSSSLRKFDIIGHMDSGQYLVVMPGTVVHTSQTVLTRIRKDWASLEHSTVMGSTFKLTCSIGLVEYKTGQTIYSVIESAELALAQSKLQGHNLVRVCSRPADPSGVCSKACLNLNAK